MENSHSNHKESGAAKSPAFAKITKELDKSLELFFAKVKEHPEVNRRKGRILAAFSGGCDSTVLLHALVSSELVSSKEITAVYIHHGISKNADAWGDFCRETAQKLGVNFVLHKVNVEPKGSGIEAAAREVRYKALNEIAEKEGCEVIVTAHHRDDQLETFLIQWIRGSGIDGLIGMPKIKWQAPTPVVRPFLDITRAEIEETARSIGLNWVEDESNQDTTYLRNCIRHKILPVIDEIRPGWKSAGARTIENLAETANVFRQEVSEKLAFCSNEKGNLLIRRLLAFDPEMRAQLLRLWMEKQRIGIPGKLKLQEILRQVESTNSVSFVLLSKGGISLRFYKGLLLTERILKKPLPEKVLRWNGEKEIDIPEYGGKFVFSKSKTGVPPELLREKELVIAPKNKEEWFRSKKDRPRKPLKQLFQEAGIPDFERSNLPLLWDQGKLVFVPFVGLSAEITTDSTADENLRIEWHPEERCW